MTTPSDPQADARMRRRIVTIRGVAYRAEGEPGEPVTAIEFRRPDEDEWTRGSFPTPSEILEMASLLATPDEAD